MKESGYNLTKNTGPSVAVDIPEHFLTGSFGNSAEAKAFRAAETELLKQGRFLDAVKPGINDLKSVAGNKYDTGIKQMLDYIKTLGK